MLIKIFLETFKNTKNAPGLILKTSSAGFSVMEREEILKKIREIKNTVDSNELPPIYLLFGDLTDEEINDLSPEMVNKLIPFIMDLNKLGGDKKEHYQKINN